MKLLVSVAALAVSLPVLCAPVPPIVVNPGDAFTMLFDGRITLPTTPPTSGPSVSFLSAMINFSDFTFVDEVALNRTRVDFRMDVSNTSGAPLTASSISSVGFNTTPTITGGSSSGVFNTVYRNDVLPGAGLVEFCTTTVLNCAGIGATGVSQGATGTAYASLFFSGTGLTSLTIDDAFIRYQDLAGVAGAFNGLGSPVPEPAAIIVLALGLVGVAVRKRFSTV